MTAAELFPRLNNIFSISSTSISVMRICRSPSVCNSVRSGGVWSLSSSVDCSQKNLLNNSDLSMSSNTRKLANVTPVYKKDSLGILENYRPISLISIVGKVMERYVYKHIYNFLLENRIISQN
jgi:hypothetical protein